MKGIEITVILDDNTKIIAGWYAPFKHPDDVLTINAVGNLGLAGLLTTELAPLKEKLDRQERIGGN